MRPRIHLAVRAAVFFLLWQTACSMVSTARAQSMADAPLVFGYFQNTLTYVDNKGPGQDYTSFSMQQLNIMLQKDLTARWTSFVNVEFVNSYSSGRMFGDMNLEEAWVRYRLGDRLNLKLGLLIPEFNRLNAIKTKMPLLPYIIRPLVYEASLSESIAIDEFVPDHAYVSLYGTVPAGPVKVDHAFYVGNSPNISTKFDNQQSGVDTSMSMLVGSRIGVRTDALQAGISGTADFVDLPPTVQEYLSDSTADLQEVPRYRLGSDLRIVVGPVTFEGELINVWYDDDISEIQINSDFYYGTVFVSVNEQLTVYAGYWHTSQDATQVVAQGFGHSLVSASWENRIPVFGGSYEVNDRVVAKATFGAVKEEVDIEEPIVPDSFEFYYYGLAVSVMF